MSLSGPWHQVTVWPQLALWVSESTAEIGGDLRSGFNDWSQRAVKQRSAYRAVCR